MKKLQKKFVTFTLGEVRLHLGKNQFKICFFARFALPLQPELNIII